MSVTNGDDAGRNSGPGALFRAGKLTDAVAAAGAAVRRAPTDLAARVLLAEFLLFAGNLERADTLLDAATQIDPQAGMVVAEFRQLIRAEQARRQFHRDGRVPEFLGEPDESQRLLLAAGVALRAGQADEAGRLAAEAETARPACPGRHNDQPFDDLRDADDLCAGTLEVLTTTGKFFWVPFARVASLECHPPRRARDLFWRRATISVTDGPDGEVYLPALYGAEAAEAEDALRLGRATDWRGGNGAPVTGIGQRTFLVGEEALGILDLGTLGFGPAGTA